jgi:riboflavin biosynthesis pyrimidine reductase
VRTLLPSDAGEPGLETIYAFPEPRDGCYVRANFVTSLDGAIEVGGRSGPLGGAGDKRIFHLLRALTDVILVGAGTARAENYGAAVLPEDRQRARVVAGQAPVPPVAVVTGRGLDPDSRIFEPVAGSPPPLILTTAAAAGSAPPTIRDRAELVVCGDEQVDLGRAIEALADRGLYRVLCEGGPKLLTELLLAGQLDELCLTLSPQLAGPARARLTSGAEWHGAQALALTTVLEQDGDLLLRYHRS